MIDTATLKARDAALRAFNAWDDAAQFASGPLNGVTVGVKANIAAAGLPWTGGMGHRQDVIASSDAAVVAGLRRAGAAIIGTLNMHEAALGATTANLFTGVTQNPHRAGYTPGGSSGGSGAAVAAGLCDIALGSDTLGSIRIPAAYNGVYGLKPTKGMVSLDGVLALEPTLDCVGPLSRDLDLMARAWSVMAPATTSTTLSRLVTLSELGGIICQPGVRAGYERALAAFDLPRSPLVLPERPAAIRLAGLQRCTRWLADWLADDLALASPELRDIIAAVNAKQVDPAIPDRIRAWLVDALGTDGVLLMPTTPHAAFPHGERAPASQADFTALASLAGLPALALPTGRDDDGLPVSVQIVGPAHSELALISLAARLRPMLGGAVIPEPLPR